MQKAYAMLTLEHLTELAGSVTATSGQVVTEGRRGAVLLDKRRRANKMVEGERGDALPE